MRKRAMETMRCMQALVRVQDRVRSQRLQLAKSKMVDEEEKKMTTQGDDNRNTGNKRWEPQQKRKDEQWIMREAQLQLDAASIRLERAQAQARASIYHQVLYVKSHWKASNIEIGVCMHPKEEPNQPF